MNELVAITDKRWVIEHIGIYAEDEIKRIRDLGLVLTAYTNRYIYWDGAILAADLGPEKARRIVPMRSLREAGVHVSLATDNVPPTLFHSIWNVVARKPVASDQAIGGEECLDREEALAAATLEGAYLTFEEDQKGSIETGKLADLAVLSADPLTCAEDELPDIVAELTIVGGRVVYDRALDGDPTGYEEEPS